MFKKNCLKIEFIAFKHYYLNNNTDIQNILHINISSYFTFKTKHNYFIKRKNKLKFES